MNIFDFFNIFTKPKAVIAKFLKATSTNAGRYRKPVRGTFGRSGSRGGMKRAGRPYNQKWK